MNTYNGMYGFVPGAGTLAQFGTDAEYVRQQMNQDLGYGQRMNQGATMANYGGSSLSQFGTNPQYVQNQMRQNMGGAQYGAQYYGGGYVGQTQGMDPMTTMRQFGSHPQYVQNQMRQEMGGAQYGAQYGGGTYAGQPQGMYPMTTMRQLGTNPQYVQNQIRQDMQGQYQRQNQSTYQAQHPYPYHIANMNVHPMTVMSQLGTNPQYVQNQIRQDVGQTEYVPEGNMMHTMGGTMMNMHGGSTLSHFGTNPQYVQNQIRQDLNYGY